MAGGTKSVSMMNVLAQLDAVRQENERLREIIDRLQEESETKIRVLQCDNQCLREQGEISDAKITKIRAIVNA